MPVRSGGAGVEEGREELVRCRCGEGLGRAAWRRPAPADELVRGREGERSKYEKIKKFRAFFANIRHRGAVWHATSVSDARVAHLAPGTNHLKDFRDTIRRFESLES